MKMDITFSSLAFDSHSFLSLFTAHSTTYFTTFVQISGYIDRLFKPTIWQPISIVLDFETVDPFST